MADGDRWFFDRVAPLYDLVMPSADPTNIEAGLGYADRPIDRLLDIGGGTGRAARAATADHRIVLDATPAMLDRVPPGIDRVLGSAPTLPIRSAAIDAVLIVDALHHLPIPEAVLAEAERVLGPGGVLLVREFDRGSVRGRGLSVAERAIGMNSHFLTADELATAIGDVGLEPTVIDRGFACAVVGRKPRPQ